MYNTYNTEEEKKKNQTGADPVKGTGFSYDPFAVSSSTTAADTARKNTAANKPGDFTYGAYAPSAAVTQAQTLLQQQLAQKPGSYTSTWSDQINSTIQQILNRDKFSYDVNQDALYQQYKDQYVNQGKLAMMDTMGQAAALTGGYGSSYGQSVGQQAYQAYLQQLNEMVPELYGMALDQYNQQGQALYDQAALMGQMEDQDYGRYRDKLSDYYTELDRLKEDARYKEETEYGRHMDEYNIAYGQHRDAVSDWQTEMDRADREYWNLYDRDYEQYADKRNFNYTDYMNALDQAYQKERDQISDQRYQNEFAYQKEQDQIAKDQWQKQYEESVRQFNAEFDENNRRYNQEWEAAQSATTGKEEDVKYYEPTQKDIDGILGHIEEIAKDPNMTLADFEDYLDELEVIRKYDPSYIRDLYNEYSGMFTSKVPKPGFVDVPLTGNNTANKPSVRLPIAMK